MQYKVPQDVQREDTIIGPLTLKQMGILGIGGGTAYAVYISLAKTYFMEIWLPPVVLIVLITLAFAFLKPLNLPFYEYLMNLIEYNVLAKKRIWIQGTGLPFFPPFDKNKKKKEEKQTKIKEQTKKQSLEELSKIMDTHGKTEELESNKKEELKKIINQNYK